MLRQLKRAAFLLAPFGLLAVWYILEDPFKVIWNYPSYIENGKAQHIFINKDFVSIQTYLKNKDRNAYQGFILGNSRSIYFRLSDWKSNAGIRNAYHMDAAGETLWGMAQKMRLLDSLNGPITHILIVTDSESMKGIEDVATPLLVKHPILSGRNEVGFQWVFANAFFRWNFILPFTDLKYGRGFLPYMRTWGIFDNYVLNYQAAANEMSLPEIDSILEVNPQSYYRRMAMDFNKDTAFKGQAYPAALDKKRQRLWLGIKQIAIKRGIDLRIVISPLFNGRPLANSDEKWLEDTFGSNRVFNFSGMNPITQHREHYYEHSHYRPHVASFLMNCVYSGATNSQVKIRLTTDSLIWPLNPQPHD